MSASKPQHQPKQVHYEAPDATSCDAIAHALCADEPITDPDIHASLRQLLRLVVAIHDRSANTQ